MAPTKSSKNKTTQVSNDAPMSFSEKEYLLISERLPALYVELHQQISSPMDFDPPSWRQNFLAFTHIVAISMYTLDDSNMPAVNYCMNTLGPMADYHTIVTGLIRGLEQRWMGGKGDVLSPDQVLENGSRLAAALDRVREAWKKDLSVGAGVVAVQRG